MPCHVACPKIEYEKEPQKALFCHGTICKKYGIAIKDAQNLVLAP